MKWIVTLILTVLFPVLVTAETVVLRSGEHADFSRIVVQFEGSTNWQFGKVSGGYELRTDATSAVFDLDKVFDLIPRRRIASLSLPGPGRIQFAVSCACQGDAFEIRRGRLVIDIKDGIADHDSQFNLFLPELPMAELELPESKSDETEHNSTPSLGSVVFSDLPGSDLPQTEISRQHAETLAALKQYTSEELGTEPVTIGEHLTSHSETGPSQSDIGENKFAEVDSIDLQRDDSLGAIKITDDPRPFLPSWPEMQASKLQPYTVTPSTRLADAESALLQQLTRAAAQGLLSVELPQLPDINAESAATENTATDKVTEPETVAEPQNTSAAIGDHLRLETAVDRGVVVDEMFGQMNSQGNLCLSGDLFEIGDWGPQGVLSGPFDSLRNGIVQEFDAPDSSAIAMLAKRHLFLGFGAELMQLLRSFDADVPNADILLQMAEILDSGKTGVFGRLDRQISCSTDGAMWAILSKEKIPAGVDIDTKAVLRAFSNIPPHLRRHLGPMLVERFLGLDDVTTAQALRKFTDRAANNRDEGFELMSAQIASYDGDTAVTLQHLEAVLATGGNKSPEALAEIIEIKIAAGIGIEERMILHADALASEYRGTDIGRRLTRSVIRGYAEAGKSELTFERIEQASENGSITVQEVAKLNADAHIKNARISSDSEFLSVVYRYPLVTGVEPNAETDARRSIAARLVQLGLPKKAQQLYSSLEIKLDQPDKMILATANLEIGMAKNAAHLLAESEGQEAQQLMALAREMQREYSAAAKMYSNLEMESERESALWRAQDMQDLAALHTGPRAIFAELTLKRGASASLQSVDMRELAIEIPTDTSKENSKLSKPIARSKALIINSSKLRNIIADLLGGN